AARANLIAWAKTGITMVRDAGSPGGVTLEIGPAPGMPAPQGPASSWLPRAAIPQICWRNRWLKPTWPAARWPRSAGAAWVKVIADFPALPASQGPSWSLSITHADPDNLCRSLQ